MSDDLNQKFVQAAVAGNLVLLEQLWLEGAEIDYVPPGGSSALFHTAFEGHPACLLFLVERGALIDIRNSVDCTPLMGAANKGKMECARILLAAGADPILRSGQRSNMSAEDWALRDKHTDVVQLLTGAVKQDVPPIIPQPRVKKEEEQVVFIKKLEDRKLQEIFNFKSRERISLIRNPEDNKVEAMTRESFSRIDDQDAIQKAFEAYKAAGGKISEDEAFPDRIVKAAFPKRTVR